MNKRLIKKRQKQFVRKINKFTLNENDVIVIHFDKENITPQELYNIMNYTHSIFKNIKIVALPDSISSKKYDKNILIEQLEETIKLLKNE